MSKLPKQYQAPLRTRKEIVQWLNDPRARGYQVRGGWNYEGDSHGSTSRGPWLFCWSVKLLARMDTSYEALLKRAKRVGVLTRQHLKDQPWLNASKARYDDTSMDSVFTHACETCQRMFVGHDGKPENDGYCMLYDGTKVTPEFTFMGRSGGWLVLTGFNGHSLNTENVGEDLDWKRWDVRNLRLLYRYVVMLEHDLRHEAIQEMVLDELAGSFFANICHDLALTKDLRGEGI